MKVAGGRRWAFLLAVFGISGVILCINLWVNPWWIAVWRFVQSLVLFSLLLLAGVRFISWLLSPLSQEAGDGSDAGVPSAEAVGQHVDLVADDRRDEELNA